MVNHVLVSGIDSKSDRTALSTTSTTETADTGITTSITTPM